MSASATAHLSPAQDPSTIEKDTDNSSTTPSKRSFFGFGKKKKEKEKDKDKEREKEKENIPSSPTRESTTPQQSTRIVSDKPPQLPQLTSVPPITTSPPSASATTPMTLPPPQKQSPSSPIRSLGGSASPPLAPRPTTASGVASPSTPRLSTSSSQIFERNVQEHPNNPLLPPPTSPAIPAHIQTENHIPPVLEASSIAITDQDCGVDEVEIVMHSMHQPAVAVVAPSAVSASTSPVQDTQLNRQGSPPFSSDANPDDASGYSADDTSSYAGMSAAATADKRRLSFISFADVVQAEQAADPTNTAPGSANRSPSRGSPVQSAVDPIAISTITETMRRSPSPIRGGDLATSPPTAGLATAGGSASSKDPGSPSKTASSDNLSVGVERGELTIETMRQALRKTGSGDLGQARSPPSARPLSIRSEKKDGWES